ncbi:MAG: T9SS type A sorting domain-containing protein [Caldithrix sp.]|nr:T9SS type A sorting domain-containing protein [Caldithrix sp.]
MVRTISILMLCLTFGFAQVLWETEMPGSIVKDLALDESDNLFIAGTVENSVAEKSWEDFYTVKISAEGDSLWAHAIHNGTEHANAVSIDGEGNVIAAGSIDKEGGWWAYDYLVTKYSNNGDMEWQSDYGGTSGRQDKVIDIITDSEGNIYATGEMHNSRNDEANMDITTIKLNSNGDTLWTRTYNSPYGLKDSPNHIHMDGTGNVFVTGDVIYVDDPNDQFAPVLLKYDTDGNLLFDSVYTGISRSLPLQDSQIGSDGSIYLYLIESLSIYNDTPYRGVRKYDSDGRFEGDMTYKADTTEWAIDHGYVGVDEDGNVFMLTQINKGEWWEGKYHVTIVSFDAAGQIRWSHEIPVEDEWDIPYDIDVDSDGNCYILYLGTAEDQYSKEAKLRKFDGDGEETFFMKSGLVDHNRGSSHIGAMRMTIDDQGHAWVVYRFADEDDAGFFRIIKYDTKINTSLRESIAGSLPEQVKLSQNYPNPFNPRTTIEYGLSEASQVNITVYNALGKKMIILVNGTKLPGYHTVEFDGSAYASGLYIYKIKTESFQQVKKMLLLK